MTYAHIHKTETMIKWRLFISVTTTGDSHTIHAIHAVCQCKCTFTKHTYNILMNFVYVILSHNHWTPYSNWRQINGQTSSACIMFHLYDYKLTTNFADFDTETLSTIEFRKLCELSALHLSIKAIFSAFKFDGKKTALLQMTQPNLTFLKFNLSQFNSVFMIFFYSWTEVSNVTITSHSK